MTYREQLDKNRIPKHVAIIMDGNGRWAKMHGLERSQGHQKGVDVVREVTAEAVRIGIKFLTLYTFSTENWNRPSDEVATLMGLILNNLSNKLFMDNNVRLICVGDSSRMPENVLVHIRQLIEDTKNNTSMTAVLALSYSSRWEITKAVQDIAKEVQEGKLNVDDINETVLNNHMATNFMPDPELLIRTGGEKRLSNYLLWQSAYSELYFCDTYWPEFTGEDLCKAVLDYQHRERRFGKTSEQINEDCNAI
ncbi:MAG: isoprenyl transferase [Bacteroidaceae bacterium]|jgi:undecaprenyl diphosphate synthase|nr:isoprenyl transferase [Bacteroidaceae bacterium]HAE25382.1 isoprenyl transferase [Prevotellaceae bacterium]